MEPDLECPICLTSIFTTPSITAGCCNKQFHTVCYTNCMINKLSCPMCRANQSSSTESIIVINPIIPVTRSPPPVPINNGCIKLMIQFTCASIIMGLFLLVTVYRR
jgi:hypothetical protein